MTFNSFQYIIFLAVTAVIVRLLDRAGRLKLRNAFLLAASYFFYAQFHLWFPVLLLYVSSAAWLGGKLISDARARGGSGKRELAVSTAATLLCLVIFKYGYVFDGSILLPVGLSFFTFQALSYTIDIYRGRILPDSPLAVFLFVAFFPTLLSGPIERARNLLPQLNRKFGFSLDGAADGVRLFIWGLFKKTVIADRLSLFVDEIYMNPAGHSGSTLAIAAVFYSFQIYADFSGWADMAIGSARILGVRLMENFNFPYFAKTVKDFWRRWHISLTSWFTEYVYISLGGNRVSRLRWVLNISLVFLLSGVWHGATLSFIVWGGVHAVLYLVEHFCGVRNGSRLYGILVFVAVTFAWIFFRLTDIGQAAGVVAAICTDLFSRPYLGSSAFSTALSAALLLFFVCREWLAFRKGADRHPSWECVLLLLAVCLFGIGGNRFVYFQF